MACSRVALVGLVLTLAACGGSGASSAVGDAGADAASQTDGGDAGLTKPKAPHLDSVERMAGVLHVQWTVLATCDAIEGERKDPANPYVVAFDVPGANTNHMDGNASENT